MKTLKEQIEGRCTHFNGAQNKCCEVGIKYDSFTKLPCLKSMKAEQVCEKLEWPSEESVLAELDAHKLAMEKFSKVTPLISRLKKEHAGKSWGGIEECPVCKGKLHLSISSYNGHTRGTCETVNCLGWIE